MDEIIVRREDYNLPELKVDFENAKFYVIKAQCEAYIRKSIKHSIWATNPEGNKKLDEAFRDEDPIFLFFSVNTSKEFLGVAEMVGEVDFEKVTDLWEGKGLFPVKWHIVKDLPISTLNDFAIESDDDKSVMVSQEVGLKKGVEILKILNSYDEKTSLLDGFNYYDKVAEWMKHVWNFKNEDGSPMDIIASTRRSICLPFRKYYINLDGNRVPFTYNFDISEWDKTPKPRNDFQMNLEKPSSS